ncbi:hypothetical protein PFLUV_G00168270 [Perca fluviatilis]|uniref:Uncharacterized protein n=1 Tax=Perca fluviatilis TaxID=8168 RepID=A0A6A5DYB9_PERFL|nr:hypothetical protein PFLUV_G00168270 [Perca fluviatilis]
MLKTGGYRPGPTIHFHFHFEQGDIKRIAALLQTPQYLIVMQPESSSAGNLRPHFLVLVHPLVEGFIGPGYS